MLWSVVMVEFVLVYECFVKSHRVLGCVVADLL